MTHTKANENEFRVFESVIIIVTLVFVVWAGHNRPLGDQAFSRLATVYSLTNHGTFYIDRPLDQPPNPFEQRTIDKVMVKGERFGDGVDGGRLVSSKPPVIPLLMTAEYVVMHRLLGWDLDNDDDVEHISRVMLMTLVGGALVATLIFFVKTLRLLGFDGLTRSVLLLSLAFGTQLWGYGLLFNAHVPGACMIVIALYFALGMGSGALAPKGWRFAAFGLAAGLTLTIDIPGGVFPAFAGCYLLYKFPRHTLTWGLLGLALPLAVHASVMVAVTGSPFPVQMHRETYLYPIAYWRHPLGIDALSERKGTYLFHMTFGRCGVFVLYPVLLGGLAGAVRALARKDTPHRGAILAGLLGFLVLTAYYVYRTDNYGGESYGFRWYICAMPVLLLMAAPVISAMRSRWHWLFVGLMMGISFYSAWECTNTGWRSSQEWTCRILGPSSR
jgi:hypothetical protein